MVEDGEKTSKAIKNRRVCYDCARPVTDPTLQICPRCGSGDIDARRAKPKQVPKREVIRLPHPWEKLELDAGGTVLLSGDAGSGKAQPLSAKVLTPGGWTTIGELKVGDLVIDPDGGTGEVTGVYDQGILPTFTVTAKDGGKTQCSGDHLWLVQSHSQRRRDTWQLLTLNEISERGVLYKSPAGERSRHNWFLPIIQPIEFDPTQEILLDPYFLGALVGDDRPIASIEPAADQEVRCIKVNTKRNLYITDDYIVTHNTSICMVARPTRYISTEQEIEQVGHAWYRMNPGIPAPTLSNCYTWKQLSEDLIGLGPGDLVVIDSISQFAAGDEVKEVVKTIIEQIRMAQARAIFIAQFRKDGVMLGPNEIRHQVDAICTIPPDKTGLRRLAFEKNRFGGLFAKYFSIGAHGIGIEKFPYAYTVEGPAGKYSLHLYPTAGGKLGGIFKAMVKAGLYIEKYASAAVECEGYRDGFAEPNDVEWRRSFAEDHGLEWISPARAKELIAEELQKTGAPQEYPA